MQLVVGYTGVLNAVDAVAPLNPILEPPTLLPGLDEPLLTCGVLPVCFPTYIH